MKRLLLFFLIVLGARNMQAQDCIGYIPEDAIVLCDTNYTLNNSDGTFWFPKDTNSLDIMGNNNIIYIENGEINLKIFGSNNTIYIKGYSAINMWGISNHNTIYMDNGFLRIDGDSNIIYGLNLGLRFYGNHNIIHAASTNIMYNSGINNVTQNDNTCTGIEFNYVNAPVNTCTQTTGIIEDPISIDVYPNPATDNVTFNLQNAGEIKTITIYDITGKTIEVIANISSDKVTIDTSKLSTGMYVYSITLANGKTERGKLLVG